ncbi:MAG: alanine racemase [Flavobacteriaceae bacterium]
MTAPAETTGVRLIIDLAALARNWKRLCDFAPRAETAAVVKADAYGLGLAETVPALVESGCRSFFVAIASEGLEVRALAPQSRVFVLSGLNAANAGLFRDERLIPVLNSMEDVGIWRKAAKAETSPLPAALHVDTGMNRLGLTAGEAGTLAKDAALLANIRLDLVMSHLACADQPANPMTGEQQVRFEAVRGLFPGVPASLANSAGILQDAGLGFDLTRPGIALYGGEAIDGAMGPMEVVVTAQARIVQVRDVMKGERIGYGATHECGRDSRVAIAAIGYGDGYHRIASGSGVPLRQLFAGAYGHIAGERVPLVGRISMDLAAFDISTLPEGFVKQGDWIEIFGENVALDDVARAAGTIGYELLTALSRRAERHYLPLRTRTH